MIDVERLVRESLARHGADVPTPDPLELHMVAVRTRRRQVLNAIGAGLIALVIVFGAATGLEAILRAAAPVPAVPPTPVPPTTPFAPVEFPPPGVPPSTPLTGRSVVSFYSEDVRTVGAGEPDEVERTEVDVYGDGRLIWSRCVTEAWTGRRPQRADQDGCSPGDLAGPEGLAGTGWVEQRITAEAVELLRNELLSTGLFARDFESVTTNSTELVDYLSAEVVGPDQRLNVRADYQTFDLNPPTPEVEAGLRHIQEIFLDLEEWLPASAWVETEVMAFVPPAYSFWFKQGRNAETIIRDALSLEVVRLEADELPPPANELLTREGCDLVTLDEARAIIEGFEAVGITASSEMSSMDILAFLVVDDEPASAVYFQPHLGPLPPDC
jgi:hypothetical protein